MLQKSFGTEISYQRRIGFRFICFCFVCMNVLPVYVCVPAVHTEARKGIRFPGTVV